MIMPHRQVGTSGPFVSALSLGSYHTYDRIRFHETVELLRAAIDYGINFFDVGVYDDPESPFFRGHPMPPVHTDVIFGRAISAIGIPRDEWVLCTKLWLEGYPGHSLSLQLDRALERIGVDHAEMAVLGDVPDDDVDLAAVTRDVGELIASGKLHAWGVNCWSAADVRRVIDVADDNGIPAPQMAQLKYTVVRRTIPEGEPFRSLFEERGLGLQASNIFEGGLLAGHPSPHRGVGRGMQEVRDRIAAIAPCVAEVAQSLGATPSQLIIAFCLSNPATVNVLFGASRMDQLTENVGALDVLDRVGADELRAAVEPLWVDRDLVDPSSSCSAATRSARP
jgi:aryl-alcohol dehydrogenase-like predicted oxidoreductase